MTTKPKILVIDIETAPAVAYVWRLFDENIPLDRLISPGRTICAAFKWYGEKGITFYSEWDDGPVAMFSGIRDALAEADAVVTFNGDKFDLPKLTGEFVQYGIKPAPPPTSIDLYKTVKKLGLTSNKLAFVGPFLKVGGKLKHEGFELWRKVMGTDCTYGEQIAAMDKMGRYNKQDVALTARVYKALRPYMANHPHIRVGACPNCGSNHVQSRGYRYTRTMKIRKVECQSCGAWSSGTRTKI